MVHYDMADSCRIPCTCFFPSNSLTFFVIASAFILSVRAFYALIQLRARYVVCCAACNANDVEKSCVDGYINIIMNDMVAVLSLQLVNVYDYAVYVWFCHFSFIWNLWLANRSHLQCCFFFSFFILFDKNLRNCCYNFHHFHVKSRILTWDRSYISW